MSECWEYPEIPGQCGAHNRRLSDCRVIQKRKEEAAAWEWGWYGNSFIITKVDGQGDAVRQIVMPSEAAAKMFGWIVKSTVRFYDPGATEDENVAQVIARFREFREDPCLRCGERHFFEKCADELRR